MCLGNVLAFHPCQSWKPAGTILTQRMRCLFLEGDHALGVPNGLNFNPSVGSTDSEAVATCRKTLMSDGLYIDRSKKYDDHLWGRWLPRATQTSQGGEETYVYSARDIKSAKQEQQRAFRVDAGKSHPDDEGFPRRTVAQLQAECVKRERSRLTLHQNGAHLHEWQESYLQQKGIVRGINEDFIKRMSMTENRNVRKVLRCPTMARIFAAFNRDLTPLTHTVWINNWTAVFVELDSISNGVLPEGTVSASNDKVRCSYCPRLIATKGMGNHVSAKHKDRYPEFERTTKGPASQAPASSSSRLEI
ncbi:hypothetical protein MVEN_02236800 [Mycena venus]|uniref:Uncharacterized protein n=1 Tax=Mycena venus TaxID=2733690 RepID=A0A8H6X761_9AGAR|nr:hypothetical protein MVEN_02236800 [Mycena venus]